MKAEQLLSDLGLSMGLNDLKFNEEGCARLVFDGTTAVNFESDASSGLLQLYTELGPLPPEGREALYLQLLQANLLCLDTQGATLAVDSANHEVVMCRMLVAEDISSANFTHVVEGFVSSAKKWRTQLDDSPALQTESPMSSMAAQPMDSFIRG